MNKGPESVSSVPHHSAAAASHGWGDDENTLKHTSRRNGCMGTWSTASAREPQKTDIVPWMSAWSVRSSESRRKAWFEIVASVSGRKMRIWSAVDSLRRTRVISLMRTSKAKQLVSFQTHLAVLVIALQRNHGFRTGMVMPLEIEEIKDRERW